MRPLLYLCAVSMLLIFASGQAQGQEADGATVTQLAPIVVSGQPAMTSGSTTIIDAQTLSAAEIRSLDQLGHQVPNLTTESGGARSFNNIFGIRGMVNTLYYSDPAVAVIVDDVAYPSTEAAVVSLNEVDSVQVLRGPQGSQFGANAPAGAIVIDPTHPGDDLRVDLRASYGTYSSQDYMLSIAGPVIPSTLSMGATFSYQSRTGFVVNQFLNDRPDHQEGYAGRFELRYQPAQDWLVRFTSDNQQYHDGPQPFTHLEGNPYTESYDFNGRSQTHANVEALHVSHTTDNFTATSITSYVDFGITPASLDFDFSSVPFQNVDFSYQHKAYTEEVKFVSNDMLNQKAAWKAGIYLTGQQFKVDNTGAFPLFGTAISGRLNSMTWEAAMYGDYSWALPESFVLTLGSRVEFNRRTASFNYLDMAGQGSGQEEDRNFLNAAPKATLAWTGDARFQPYASTGLSYRNGGYSTFLINPFINDFSGEQTWANEIGVNSTWLNGAVTANAAAFWNESRNYQLEIYEVGEFSLINAPRVTSRGGELSCTEHLTSWFALTESIGYTEATFDRFTFPVTGEDEEGKHVPFVPQYNGVFAAELHHPDGYMARVEGVLTGTTYFDSSNTALYKQDAYALLNLKLGFEQRNWGAYVFGKNLTGTEYRTLEISPGDVGIPANPRELGVEVTCHY